MERKIINEEVNNGKSNGASIWKRIGLFVLALGMALFTAIVINI